MKIAATFLIAATLAAPAMAGDRAGQLPPIDAGTIWNQINNVHNPFPQPVPTTLDYCVFTEFKNNKCIFKCESGAILVEPAVKPDFSAGEPAGACATHIIRPIKPAFPNKSVAAEQTFNSYGKYATAQKASEVLNWAVNGLKFAKAEVTGQTLVVKGLSDYGFRITFRAASQLAIEPGPTFRNELDAYERMFEMADRLEDRGARVAIHEVIAYGPGEYAYIIGFFEGEKTARKAGDKKLKACVLNSYANNVCNYKCNDGSAYTQPMSTPGPWNNDPVAFCPQLVFPF